MQHSGRERGRVVWNMQTSGFKICRAAILHEETINHGRVSQRHSCADHWIFILTAWAKYWSLALPADLTRAMTISTLITLFHCFWKANLSSISLRSLYMTCHISCTAPYCIAITHCITYEWTHRAAHTCTDNIIDISQQAVVITGQE